jgi:hypothetical protein
VTSPSRRPSRSATLGCSPPCGRELGFADAFRRVLRNRRQFDAERLLRVMVFNRLCDPESKLGILRWLEGTRVPEVATESVTHQHLLRTMDTLADGAETMDKVLAGLLRPLIDQELSIVFYDLTTIRTEGGTELSGEVRRFGLSKDGGIVRQVMLGVVQTAEGLPIHHEVFAGNSGETTTLVPTIEKVLARYPIKRVVLVADRGLLSLDNLEAIRAIRVGGQPLEFILSVPARRYTDFDTLLAIPSGLSFRNRTGHRGNGMAGLSSGGSAPPIRRQQTWSSAG